MTASPPQKAAMLVAQRIVGDVVRLGLQPGDLLSSERVMIETYETGRGTLREALRVLEFQGVITPEPGPGGGPMLLRPDSGPLASTLVLFLQLNGAPFRSIVQVRLPLEPMISSLAATRISDESLEQLAGTIERMRTDIDDQHAFLEANKKFHEVIAWSSGNLLFSYLIESLLGIMDGTVIGIDYPAPRRAAILKAHDEIYQALAKRDPELSLERMREHIDAYETYAERKFPEVLDQVIRWDHLR